jgi:hypothetical protein
VSQLVSREDERVKKEMTAMSSQQPRTTTKEHETYGANLNEVGLC